MAHSRLHFLALSACLPAAAAGGALLPDLDLRFRNEFHSAYLSATTGGMGETRPVLTQTFGGSYRLGEWGKIGGYAWARSALTGQKDEYRRREFECFEYGVEYSYTWKFMDGLGLFSYIDHLWSPAPGWYERDDILHGVIFEQALENPWVTPYYRFFGSYRPSRWMTLKAGLRQPFNILFDGLTVTPYAELHGGDSRRYRSKYGDDPFDTCCGIGLMASEFGATIVYKVSEYISTRLRLRNWNLLDESARQHEKSRDEPWHVCWLPIATLAVDITF